MKLLNEIPTAAPVTVDSSEGRQVLDIFSVQFNATALTQEAAQRLLADPDFAPALQMAIRRFSAEKQNPYGVARSILGEDFIAPEEIALANRGVFYTPDQIEALDQSVPSAEILEWCGQNGYVVLPAPPKDMTLGQIRCLDRNGFFAKNELFFTNPDKTSFGWLMIKKSPLSNSLRRPLTDQITLLSKEETVPNAAQVSWLIMTYLKVRKIELFKDNAVRTSSADGDERSIQIGSQGVITVESDYGACADSRVGLAAMKKQ